MNSGYIVVNSYCSPAIAASRFVTVSFTCPATRKCASAWTVSAAAAALKSFAICLRPSASAFLAKARYFRFAWLSPANAAMRLSSVAMPSSSG